MNKGLALKPVVWPALLGIRNRARAERLPAGALVTANNVDLEASGTVERREGYTRALALSGCTSSYATRNGETLVVLETLHEAFYNFVVSDARTIPHSWAGWPA